MTAFLFAVLTSPTTVAPAFAVDLFANGPRTLWGSFETAPRPAPIRAGW